MLRTLLPDESDAAGLLALILLTNIRSATRITSDGAVALLSAQYRSQWNASVISEGVALFGWRSDVDLREDSR